MKATSICWLAQLLFFNLLIGQINPRPGASLNYTQVMFEHEAVAGALQYTIQIIPDTVGSSFNNPFIQKTDSAPAVIIGGLKFGNKYLWRYTPVYQDGKQEWAGPYNFEISKIQERAGQQFSVAVSKKDSSLKTGLIALDLIHLITDLDGEPIWFMRFSNSQLENEITEDLTLTPQGTITFLTPLYGIETDLEGNQIWKTPDLGIVRHVSLLLHGYHHCFMKLPNGNYMVLKNTYVPEDLPPWCDTTAVNDKSAERNGDTIKLTQGYTLLKKGNWYQMMVPIGIIAEYNPEGEQVWMWDSKNYLKYDEIFPKGMSLSVPSRLSDPHLNAFTVDEKNGYVYAGFKNLSRIIRIEKKSGNVLQTWGKTRDDAHPRQGNGFFYHQHGATVLKDNCFAVYSNNDTAQERSVPSAVIFSMGGYHDTAKVIQRFSFAPNTLLYSKVARGGNVDDIGNGNLLISTGSAGRVVIIKHDNTLLWDAMPKAKGKHDTIAKPAGLYRAHYTSSLYPCYFAIQAGKHTLDPKHSSVELQIFNVGTEADEYSIDVSSERKHFSQQLNTSMEAGKSKMIEIKLKSAPPKNKPVIVTVVSKTNPNLKREIQLTCENK